MTRLIIVRHAETDYNCQGRIQGHCDSKLTVKGLQQVHRLTRRFKKIKIDKIYSSDLGRAYSSALDISKHKKIPIVRDPHLREVQLGEWEGMTPKQVDKLYDQGFQKWLRKPSAVRIPRSESLKSFRGRVVSCVENIAKKNVGKTVLIVTHGGAITALLAHWLKADFDTLLLNLQIDNTSLTLVEKTEKRTRLLYINDATHLHDLNS